MKKIVINPEKCTGCRDCELICSMNKTGSFNPMRSLIRAIYFPVDMVSIPLTCMQCEEPLCQDVCPAGAIKRNEVGAVIIDRDKCIGCNMCVSVCPVGAIKEVPGSGIVTKCNLCDGEPACVEICHAGALKYEEVDDYDVDKNREAAEKIRKVLKGGRF